MIHGCISRKVCFTENKLGHTASRLGQANAPKRCLLAADRASVQPLADDRPFQKQPPSKRDRELIYKVAKRPRSLEAKRKKRLWRNAKKREALKTMTCKERLSRESKDNKKLKDELLKIKQEYRHEKRLSVFCWNRWKKELEMRKISINRYYNSSSDIS